MKIRTYLELSRLETFEERLDYLMLTGRVGQDTFGFDRYFNQRFYRSMEWKHIRDEVIARDLGCDLGVEGYEINGQRVVIHHLNPITMDDLETHSDQLLNPEFLITTTYPTHNAIHFGVKNNLFPKQVERTPFDTCPWKQ